MSFIERFIDANGFRIRYMEAGQGAALVHLHGAGGLRLNPAHDLLARRFRVIAFEMPSLGESPAVASTMGRAIKNLGIDSFDLMGTSFGGTTALWLALQAPERVRALVLEAPAAIRQEAVDAELESRLPNLATPTLVLFGTLDAVIAPAMGRVYTDLMPNAHLVFVYDAGHAIATERPDAFAEVVLDFLERHEAFVISRAETVIHP
jgi:pimeloyl-ACP methyl ester carboxylesterase